MNLKKYIPKDGKMTKNEFKQMVNIISEYEKRLFDRYLEIENIRNKYEFLIKCNKSQQQEIDRLEVENEKLKADVKELEIEFNRRVIK